MSILRPNGLQRKDYFVKNMEAYNMPKLPQGYKWKLWKPKTKYATIAFLELRKYVSVFFEVIDSRMIMVDEPEELASVIRVQALQLALLRAMNVKVHETDTSSRILLEESYELWEALQEAMPKLPSTHLWEVYSESPETFVVILKRRILRSDDTIILYKHRIARNPHESLSTEDISKVSQAIYMEEFMK